MTAVDQFRSILQRGEYEHALKEEGLRRELAELASRESWTDEGCLDASALLAELYDQTSRYEDSAEVISFDPGGDQALKELQNFTKDGSQELAERSSNTSKLRRAQAMFCLAHAISLHRHTGDHGKSMAEATTLAKNVVQELGKLQRLGFHLSGAQSYSNYWLGRFHLLRDALVEAESAFEKSIHHLHMNAEFHLRHHQTDAEHDAGTSRNCRRCQAQAAFTNYLLASNMAFGLATLRLKTGRLSEALTLLNPAITLLEGSTSDRYRKGYAKLLAGTAHRFLGGAHHNKMATVLDTLEEAKSLFGSDRTLNWAHRYYADRVSYQMCLANLYIVMDKEAPLETRKRAICKALGHFIDVGVSQVEGRAGEVFKDIDLALRSRLLAVNLACELVKVLDTDDVELRRLHLRFAKNELAALPRVEVFSRFLSSLPTQHAGIEQFTASLLVEAAENLKAARKDADRLRGDHFRPGNITLASAELASTVLERLLRLKEKKRATVERLEDEQRADRDVKPQASGSKSLEQAKLDLAAITVQADLALGKLLSTKEDLEHFLQVQDKNDGRYIASAHVALARIFWLEGNRVTVRRHLEYGWRPWIGKVEMQIIHDRAEELLKAMPKAAEVVMPLELDGHPLSLGELKKNLYRVILTTANEEGLTEDQLAIRLQVNIDTVRKLKKEANYIWKKMHERLN